MLICNSTALTSTPSHNSDALIETKGFSWNFTRLWVHIVYKSQLLWNSDSWFLKYSSVLQNLYYHVIHLLKKFTFLRIHQINPHLMLGNICFSQYSFTGDGYFVWSCFLNPRKTTPGWFQFHAAQISPRRDWHFSFCGFREYLNILYKKNSFSRDTEGPPPWRMLPT